MGPGHFGVGLALKPAAPKVPLVILLIATVLLDLLSFGFLASGLEETNQTHFDLTSGITLLKPGSLGWSHGLFMSLVWSTMAAVITFLIFKQKRGALIVSGLVFSHWVLDFIVHLSDLPLFFDGSPLLGLGLWGQGQDLSFRYSLKSSYCWWDL